MPIYVYRNLKTGITFEIEQRMTEAALTEHPETGDPVKRLIQPVGIAFKGSGFYVTDSRSTSAAGANGKSTNGKEGAKASESSTGTNSGSGDGGAAASKSESAKPSKTDGKGESKSKNAAASGDS